MIIEWKTVRIDYPQLRGAQSIEEVLCLATLVANKMDGIENIKDAKEFYESCRDCGDCPFFYACLACKINE